MYKLLNSIVVVLLMSSMTSCYTLTTHQTGRTLGENNDEFRYSFNLRSGPNALDGEDATDEYYEGKIAISIAQIQYIRGFTDKLDIGFTVGIEKFGLLSKYQFYGDHESKLALAAGVNLFSTFFNTEPILPPYPLFQLAYGAELPLYMSFHPTKHISLYSNPVISYNSPFMTYSDDERQLSFYYKGFYKGLSSGVQFTIPWLAPSENSTFSLSLEFNWGAPLNGNDYIFSGGFGVIFRGFNY